MTDKIDFLKKKLDEVQTVLKQNMDAHKELQNTISTSIEKQKEISANVIKLQGIHEGIQFSISQVEEGNKENPPVADPMNDVGEVTDLQEITN